MVLSIVCLAVTGAGVGWAEPAQVDPQVDPEVLDWVDNPYAPHKTSGSTARIGTAVGFLYGEPLDVLAIGATAAVGQRFGRLAIEAELAVLALEERTPQAPRLGDAERLGAIARFDVLRIGPRWVGPNSLLSVYVEGGADVAWNHWYPLAANEVRRVVPADTKRVEGQAGFGIALDHRLQEPIGFPHRIGWFLGWRFGLSPVDAGSGTECRSQGPASCRTITPPMTAPSDRIVNRSLLFQSSLVMTW